MCCVEEMLLLDKPAAITKQHGTAESNCSGEYLRQLLCANCFTGGTEAGQIYCRIAFGDPAGRLLNTHISFDTLRT